MKSISRHLVLVYNDLSDTNCWATAAEIAESTGIARRTASLHANTLAKAGLFERLETFPHHSFRLLRKGLSKDAIALRGRILAAADAMSRV